MNAELRQRIASRLTFVYGSDTAATLLPQIEQRIAAHLPAIPPRPARRWDASDAMLITYADSIVRDREPPLRTLHTFLGRHAAHRLPWVHLLPFFPWSSDDGFSVIDYRAIADGLGSWDDIAGLARDHRLVFDGVINHCSFHSRYVQGFLAGDPAYADFVISLPPDTDTRSVLRTRNLPLLHDYETPNGGKVWLWTTFSRDQVDLNFANPRVLLEILDILLFYAARGASVIRLDAIPYMWKRLGTSCAHLPETHALIKLIRDVYDACAPHMLLLTETNVPHLENVSYFGDAGDEAQIIYNFSLPPLIVHSILTGDCSRLRDWARCVRKVGDRCTFLNITATHDGIGMRPTEGILSEPERARLLELARARGGDVTGKRNPDGSISPYELNLSYFDAVNDPAAEDPLPLQVERFMMSQTIALSFIGIPGIYIQSLLGSRNDLEGVRRTGRARSINRPRLDADALEQDLSTPGSLRAAVLSEYVRRLALRTQLPALHPDADQEILDAGPGIFALRRIAQDGSELVALHNVTSAPARTRIGGNLWRDALANHESVEGGSVALGPCQCRWLIPQ